MHVPNSGITVREFYSNLRLLLVDFHGCKCVCNVRSPGAKWCTASTLLQDFLHGCPWAFGILRCMSSNPTSRIQDLCSKAMSATDPGQIEPIFTELRIALNEKLRIGETWMSLCERAAVE